MKISFITTVFNEESSIEKFFDSLLSQSKLPDEIIIVDGGSKDDTVKSIKYKVSRIKYKGKFLVLTKKGNRSVGRNEAIRNATGEVIVCTDAGNILDKDWIKKITEPFRNAKVDVVAGYYRGLAKNVFQKCLLPYALVMPDKVDPQHFLPATRSIAFTKKVWERVGGFDEQLSHNEDYAFAKSLEKGGAKIVFAKDAVVNWIPRNNFKQAFIMFFRFAYGDAEAGIFRPKVILIYLRYLIGFFLLILAIIVRSVSLLEILFIFIILYFYWSIYKNYKYVNQWQAIFILPMLQLVADWAVLKGTVLGIIKVYPY